MALLQTIRNFLVPLQKIEEEIVPASPTVYSIRPLTSAQLKEVLRLNLRCFKNGEHYTKYTFSYLLNQANTVSYRVVTPGDEMIGFVFVIVNETGAGHLTTLGVAPEHRRRGVAEMLLEHIETALTHRNISTVVLEVRASNLAAQNLYRNAGYTAVQSIAKYYNNGEDCYLMMKSLI